MAPVLAGELELPPLSAGETLQSESFDIDGSGRFTYLRHVGRKAGLLGVEIRPVDRDAAGRLNAPPFIGVLVVSVEEGGPADRAGIVRDDIILAIGDEAALSAAQFSSLVEDIPPGTEVTIGILREETRQDFRVTLGSQPRLLTGSVSRDLPVIDDRSRTGMVLAEPTPEVSSLLSRLAGAPGGLLVAEVLPGGPAFLAGVYRRDILIEAAGRPLRTAEDYRSTVMGSPRGKELEIALSRRGARREMRLVPGQEVTQVREVDGPLGLFSFKSSAQERRFSILWGLLYHSRRDHEVLDLGSREEHRSGRDVGVLLNFLNYSSREGREEMRLLWIIPVFSASRSSLEPMGASAGE